MNEKNDDFEKFIKKELDKEAADIYKEIQDGTGEGDTPAADVVPPEVKERMRENLRKQTETYDRERMYAMLPEADREALRLGHEILRKRSGHTVLRKKRRIRVSLALAATLVLVIAIGVTSFGGAGKIIRLFEIMIGERAVMQVDSGENNKIINQENEEEAYQRIEDEFGTEPVRIITKPEGMEFQRMEYEKEMQVAELYYTYNGESVMYMMSTANRDASWGVDVEDKLAGEYEKVKKDCTIHVKEYNIAESDEHRYSAKFKHKGIEYFMVGTMKQAEFDIILENLHFFK